MPNLTALAGIVLVATAPYASAQWSCGGIHPPSMEPECSAQQERIDDLQQQLQDERARRENEELQREIDQPPQESGYRANDND